MKNSAGKYEFLWEIQANYVYSDGRCSAPFSHSVVYFISQLSSHFFSGNFQVQARVKKNFHVKVSKSRQILLFKQKEGAKKNGNFGVFLGLDNGIKGEVTTKFNQLLSV